MKKKSLPKPPKRPSKKKGGGKGGSGFFNRLVRGQHQASSASAVLAALAPEDEMVGGADPDATTSSSSSSSSSNSAFDEVAGAAAAAAPPPKPDAPPSSSALSSSSSSLPPPVRFLDSDGNHSLQRGGPLRNGSLDVTNHSRNRNSSRPSNQQRGSSSTMLLENHGQQQQEEDDESSTDEEMSPLPSLSSQFHSFGGGSSLAYRMPLSLQQPPGGGLKRRIGTPFAKQKHPRRRSLSSCGDGNNDAENRDDDGSDDDGRRQPVGLAPKKLPCELFGDGGNHRGLRTNNSRRNRGGGRTAGGTSNGYFYDSQDSYSSDDEFWGGGSSSSTSSSSSTTTPRVVSGDDYWVQCYGAERPRPPLDESWSARRPPPPRGCLSAPAAGRAGTSTGNGNGAASATAGRRQSVSVSPASPHPLGSTATPNNNSQQQPQEEVLLATPKPGDYLKQLESLRGCNGNDDATNSGPLADCRSGNKRSVRFGRNKAAVYDVNCPAGEMTPMTDDQTLRDYPNEGKKKRRRRGRFGSEDGDSDEEEEQERLMTLETKRNSELLSIWNDHEFDFEYTFEDGDDDGDGEEGRSSSSPPRVGFPPTGENRSGGVSGPSGAPGTTSSLSSVPSNSFRAASPCEERRRSSLFSPQPGQKSLLEGARGGEISGHDASAACDDDEPMQFHDGDVEEEDIVDAGAAADDENDDVWTSLQGLSMLSKQHMPSSGGGDSASATDPEEKPPSPQRDAAPLRKVLLNEDLAVVSTFTALEEAADDTLSELEVLDKLAKANYTTVECTATADSSSGPSNDGSNDGLHWVRALVSKNSNRLTHLFRQEVLQKMRAATTLLQRNTSISAVEQTISILEQQPEHIEKLQLSTLKDATQFETELVQSLLERLQLEAQTIERSSSNLSLAQQPLKTPQRILEKLVREYESDIAILEQDISVRRAYNAESFRFLRLTDQVTTMETEILVSKLLVGLAPFELTQLDDDTTFCLVFESPVKGVQTALKLNATGDLTSLDTDLSTDHLLASGEDAKEDDPESSPEEEIRLIPQTHAAAGFYIAMQALLLRTVAKALLNNVEQQQQQLSTHHHPFSCEVDESLAWVDAMLWRLQLATWDIYEVVSRKFSVSICNGDCDEDVVVEVSPPQQLSSSGDDSSRSDKVQLTYDCKNCRCVQWSLPSTVTVWNNGAVVDELPPGVRNAPWKTSSIQTASTLYQTLCESLWPDDKPLPPSTSAPTDDEVTRIEI